MTDLLYSTHNPPTVSNPNQAIATSSCVVDYLADTTRERKREYQRKYYAANRDRLRKRYAENIAESREYWREYIRKWRLNNREHYLEYTQKYRTKKNTQGRLKQYHLKRYSITPAQYDKLITAQNGVCAVCKQPCCARALSVDHDHRCCVGKRSCGKCVRGLLCSKCNHALGLFHDSPALLFAAIEYIIKHAEEK